MKHFTMCAAFLFSASIALAQTKPSAGMAFPSDSQPASTAGAAEMLQAVCPGKVEAGKGVSCKGDCPEPTGFAGNAEPGGWWVSAVTRGHFLSATSDDAALAMAGCESHAESFGGTILLTREGNRWKMRSYKSGLTTDKCHKVTREDGRDLLVCAGGWTGQGEVFGNLFLTDLRTGQTIGDTAFFRTEDSVGTCGGLDREHPEPVIAATIDRVDFLPGKSHGLPGIVVTASYGKKPIKSSDWQSCIDGKLAPPPTKAYQIEFQFDGTNYRPTPSSAAAVKVFENN